MASIDVKDAFPTVQQEVPTRVTCTADAAGSSVSYSLGRVLPGQRDGSLLWYKDLAPFVGMFSGNGGIQTLSKHSQEQEW